MEQTRNGNGNGTLFLSAGVGKRHSISRAAAARYAGRNLGDALGQIIGQEIRDPDLRQLLGQLLGEPTLALELFAGTRHGESLETPVSRSTPFDTVLDALDTHEETEIGMAKTHRGGARRA